MTFRRNGQILPILEGRHSRVQKGLLRDDEERHCQQRDDRPTRADHQGLGRQMQCYGNFIGFLEDSSSFKAEELLLKQEMCEHDELLPRGIVYLPLATIHFQQAYEEFEQKAEQMMQDISKNVDALIQSLAGAKSQLEQILNNKDITPKELADQMKQFIQQNPQVLRLRN